MDAYVGYEWSLYNVLWTCSMWATKQCETTKTTLCRAVRPMQIHVRRGGGVVRLEKGLRMLYLIFQCRRRAGGVADRPKSS